MIEQVIDRRLPGQQIRLRPVVSEARPILVSAVPIESKDKEVAPLYLPAGTNVSLRVETSIQGGAEFHFLGQIEMAEDLEVAFGTPAKQKSETVTVVPDSEKRRATVKALDRAGMHHDFAAIEAFFAARNREDARLARAFLEERGDLLSKHNIDPAKVRRVEFITIL
ncbi:MAG TPA: hypothetical protein VNA13_03665 [Xanthomonadales bacterium]|nr:hypothetical protein [Xanthomonadales bacterium]